MRACVHAYVRVYTYICACVSSCVSYVRAIVCVNVRACVCAHERSCARLDVQLHGPHNGFHIHYFADVRSNAIEFLTRDHDMGSNNLGL